MLPVASIDGEKTWVRMVSEVDSQPDNVRHGAKIRILLSLVRLRGEKLNPSGICERAAANQNTWYRHRETLLDTYGVIEEAGSAGNSPLYRVDRKHPIVQRLDEARDLAAAERNRPTDPDRE